MNFQRVTYRTSQRRGNNEEDYFWVSWKRDTLEACGLWREWLNSSTILTLIFLNRAWFGGWHLKCLSHHWVKVLSEVEGNYSLLLTAEQYWFANPAWVKWGGREDRQWASCLSAKCSCGDEGSESSPEFKQTDPVLTVWSTLYPIEGSFGLLWDININKHKTCMIAYNLNVGY